MDVARDLGPLGCLGGGLVFKLCPTLATHGILHIRILEWVAISFSIGCISGSVLPRMGEVTVPLDRRVSESVRPPDCVPSGL